MSRKERHPWIKIKKYPHIGFQLKEENIPELETYIMDDKNIAKHSFLPFLHRTVFQRKFRANDKGVKNKCKKRKRVKHKPKSREIFFASHLDSQIYSYYSYLLSDKYEKFIKNKPFNKSVVAYRKIEIEGQKNKNKCNIDFALEAFSFIKENNDKELTVIVADITKFFDSLDRKILKRKWSEVWNNSNTLEKDHYNVYKSLTNIRYVNEDILFRKYKSDIWVKTKAENNPYKTKFKQKPIKHKRFLKDHNAVAYCTKKEFLQNSISLVSKSSKTKGIPQGTALSATLANIYMLDFDQEIHNYINNINGFYQRYSDDLILIVPRKQQKQAIKTLRDLVSDENKVNLEIHPDKTKVYHFHKEQGQFVGFEVNENTGTKKAKTLEYLGFEYNGKRALIKTAGYSKFNRSMKKSFKRATSLAINASTTPNEIYKNSLYKRFTYKGARRRQIYNKNTKTTRYDWGNYLSYVEKANVTFKGFNGGNHIKRQSRKVWSRFYDLMRISLQKIEKSKQSYLKIVSEHIKK
ncbi:MAG: hypothetical protein CSA38_02705 [Flavobacteriales bacterium]|nr:MAG: hypothetical protein CSA38_02705 [Flavobacteriales bacterium]